jgi:hypothetical protein
MIFSALRERCAEEYEFVTHQLELGLDAVLRMPGMPAKDQTDYGDLHGLPARLAPEVEVRTWREATPGAQPDLLHKQYVTPAGTLETIVRRTEDWPYGDRVPLMDDFLSPRSQKFLVTGPEDLPALEYLFPPPAASDLDALHAEAQRARAFVREQGVLWETGWGVGADTLGWLCGFENMCLLALEQPGFLGDLLELIGRWNRRRMEVVLDAGIDLFVRRGWYEGTDFWSPALYRRFIHPHLKREVELAHQAGAKFGYIMTSGMMPLLDQFLEIGFDVLIGVDPIQGKGTSMAAAKEKLGGRVALWGGVNGFLTMEQGTEDDVRSAVEEAMATLAPGGGFILSPVDNVTLDNDLAWGNVLTMIERWMDLRGG